MERWEKDRGHLYKMGVTNRNDKRRSSVPLGGDGRGERLTQLKKYPSPGGIKMGKEQVRERLKKVEGRGGGGEIEKLKRGPSVAFEK